MKSNEERLQDLLAYVDSLTRVHPSEIPGIDLYMDQVTTFMDSHLNTSKWLGEDKILTKTMINNYAKNNLLPPPVKKRYSKNHLLMLILIYYLKHELKDRFHLQAEVGALFFMIQSLIEEQIIYLENILMI